MNSNRMTNMHTRLALASLLAGAVLLNGCNGAERTATLMPPMVAPQVYTEPEERVTNPGSLYSEASSSYLFDDNRARKVGDIILVKIVETSKAKHKADTKADRESTNNIGVTAAFGKNSLTSLIPVGPNPVVQTSTRTEHEATGETKRENYISATMGARVVQVLPNGVMQVQGAREIKVNDETQYMVVSGLVRQRDIDQDNAVLSTQMADSRIDYYGRGVLADKQKGGWLTRLLDMVWPF
jgi:flagellar L-ring protein precursor FlgH